MSKSCKTAMSWCVRNTIKASMHRSLKEEVLHFKGSVAAASMHQSCAAGCVRVFACLSSTNSIIAMTRLLLGAVLLGNLRVCVTAQVPEMLTPPAQVRFDSVDYKNVLHWTPPANTTSLQYYVQWKIYGEPQWLDVDGCQGIQKHQCDLSSVTSDPREWYYARVHASSLPSSKSAWALSPRFSPRWATKISPPVLKLNVTELGIVVRAKPQRLLVRKIHSCLHYKIYLIDTRGEEVVFDMDCRSKKLILDKLKHKAKYCLQAQTLIPLQAKTSDRNSVKCVITL
ncbi:interleukin-22 receptor subunit alpha-2 [Thunnus maccoyii]|uniref:interleukin-22 receptor subunit alpha-2 n=1 Tax=Thunnus maccoyii TaxID=8240 RepID=UPI001C4BD587|nr:interleukin-22 receptor subunit alpha-2 [Thunnus maccoyii]XP_042289793.1 interleukin-22 receptor subunit alpha-2 [Thunnus maccoyii]